MRLKFLGIGIVSFIIGWFLSFIFYTKEINVVNKLEKSENSEIINSPQVDNDNSFSHNNSNSGSIEYSDPATDIKENYSSDKEYNLVEKNIDANIPSYVKSTLDFILKNKEAPPGFVGGRDFYNREDQLPKHKDNTKLFYKEWDVHQKVKGQNRGAERLVTNQFGEAYFTKDHYKTFIKIK